MALPSAKFSLFCLAGLMLSGSALAQKTPPPSQMGQLLCCIDASGRRACGDTLPAQCQGRAYKIYNRQGVVIREIGPPMTAEEKAAKAEEEQKAKAAEEAAADQRRKDAALLDTYANIGEIDRMQARSEADAKSVITTAQAKLAEAQKKKQKIAGEAEFYKGKELPPEIAKGLRENDREIKSQSELIDSKQKELEQIRAKYEADRKRYQELKGGSGTPRR